MLLDSTTVLSQRQALLACLGLGNGYSILSLPSASFLQGLGSFLEGIYGTSVHAWLDGRTVAGVGEVLEPGVNGKV